ncbi:IclR family transcriptional regulator [Paraburkholderia lycopersici]|uniref:Transcriptional regulator, IclR family n=1 Tax=Paraburkholderia lycopersici TaxID=416944 RepID=A0A1G6TQQ3_9BURK|nr:IclR family transcriptional regulator [Paraburkholderia lycopersici]SDD31381.1 transcriptional regulator, IclR family [Paraburkholderia lycopersici]
MKPTDRALGIFEAFETAGRPMTLSELADAAGLPVSTSHGIVRVLMERGYLYLTSRRKDLYPTRRLYDMAEKIIARDPYLERFEPFLERLRDATQETVIVGKRQHDQIVYLRVLEGPQTIRYSSAAGALKPLHSTSIGKAMLSRVAPEELRRQLVQAPLPAVTDHTVTSHEALFAEIALARERGYFVTRGESVSDVYAVAVPVNVNRDVLGIAVAGPRHRMEGEIERVAARLLDVRREIEQGNP